MPTKSRKKLKIKLWDKRRCFIVTPNSDMFYSAHFGGLTYQDLDIFSVFPVFPQFVIV